MNGERVTVNGAHIANGVHNIVTDTPPSAGRAKPASIAQNPLAPPLPTAASHTSNVANRDTLSDPRPLGSALQDAASERGQAPTEILRLISQESYLPLATLISRVSQSCWNGLSELVEQLASVAIPDLPPEQARLLPNGQPNNQLKPNLDKKERLLRFANDQKADFIKLLVLLQWSKNVEEVSNTISINFWLMSRRRAYWEAIAALALLKQESPGFQIPNPDLKTAAEVLSRGTVKSFPRLGYIAPKDLSNKQILRVIKSLNHALSVKLALSEDLPSQLRNFRVHDGRATFSVQDEFELDLSVLDESLESTFRMVDFRFSFQPSPQMPERLKTEIEFLANSNIDQGGLARCYEFLHELTLSYKLAELHKQAIVLSRNQWAGNIRVELLRRNLVVQYWSERHIGKSWIEVGIASGRRRQNSTEAESRSFLEVKCTWHGKRVESVQVDFNESVLNFEDILRQVVAQHSTQILDGIYEKLVVAPLFADAELSLEQSLSYEDPEECSLVMQTSYSSQLQLKVNAITGLIMTSPVTERTERLQFEVNRVQAVPDEVASKLLNFRCSIMESIVLAGISGTQWEALRTFKFTQAELKSLFGRPVTRINMFRQRQWALEHSLAVTHGQDGDYWWLLQQISVGASNSQARYKVLRHQKIEVKDDLSSAYFERLAHYSMGLICLQRNADFLVERKEKFDLRPFPVFRRHYELPQLSFDLDLARPAFARVFQPLSLPPVSLHAQAAESPVSKTPSLLRKVNLRFGGADKTGNKITTIAHYQNQASRSVLKRLDKSIVDHGVTLNSEDRMVTIRVETPMADAAITGIVAKILDLEKVVSTVEEIHCLPGLKLQTIENSRISMVYHQESATELGIIFIFTNGGSAPQLEFIPAETNPHQLLLQAYTKTFAANREPFAMTIRNFLTSLIATLPLAAFLHKLQQRHGPSSKIAPQGSPAEQEDHLRVHVLARDETHFAIQYFLLARQSQKDVKNNSPPQLLARFEAVQQFNEIVKKPGWLVRPAFDTFQSYARPSYTSPELGSKVKQEIFSPRAEGQSKWFPLDGGAWCTLDQPEPLLQALHDVLMTWAKDGKAASGKPVNIQAPNKIKAPQANPNPNNANMPNGASNKSGPAKPPPGRLPNSSNVVQNGANMKAQRPPPAAVGGRSMPGNAKMNTKNLQNKEVITLD
ncbi:mediator complex subunit [Cladophialophora chaetospira]|uniref:Mediator of RNA polymerase II transcription subunit 14 n=1 Tax=Cladophialophora chaetospira TaxID=386627 RepID=A0AA38X8B6_9EURO|nr:mediator complex subunit [Cladophialophora chaetospira]